MNNICPWLAKIPLRFEKVILASVFVGERLEWTQILIA